MSGIEKWTQRIIGATILLVGLKVYMVGSIAFTAFERVNDRVDRLERRVEVLGGLWAFVERNKSDPGLCVKKSIERAGLGVAPELTPEKIAGPPVKAAEVTE